MNIIDKFYTGGKAAKYEESRKNNPKWQFEDECLINTLKKLNDVYTIVDAPVGTGRFVLFYHDINPNYKLYGVDYSKDMLRLAQEKINSTNIEFVKHDIINSHLNLTVDLVVCYRFLNLLNWDDACRAIVNLLSASKKYALLSIRLVDKKYKGQKFIENKIYLHSEEDFFDLINAKGFNVNNIFDFTDKREGNYKVVLCERDRQIVHSRVAKSNRISFVYGQEGRKGKIYQLFNNDHARFVSNVCEHKDISKYFPNIIKVENEFIDAEWVEGKTPDSKMFELATKVLFSIQSVNLNENSHFDYVEDLIIPRFKNLHPVLTIDLCNSIISKILNGSKKYSPRISHPDITPNNIIMAENEFIIIDNELICKSRHHRIDILNMIKSCPPELKNKFFEEFLQFERMSYKDFALELEYLKALWVAREAGSFSVSGNIADALQIVNRYNQGDSILPISFENNVLPQQGENVLSGEYAQRGEYHKYLDPNWSYYPIYIRKIAFIDKYLQQIDSASKILDAGCGEGVLVEKYRNLGKNIVGLDLNVSNENVQKGDILRMPFDDEYYDIGLFLDVIEHLDVREQPFALAELKRVLKPKGKLIISILNLAHRASRWQFYKKGELIRTANINKHPGDRPIKEYIGLIKKSGFKIEERVPVKLTLPPLQEKLLRKFLGKRLFEKFIYSTKRNPDDCFLNIFVLKKCRDNL